MPDRSPMALCLPVVFALFLSGCGNDCQSTCNKLYGTAPNCGQSKGERGSANFVPGLVDFGETREKKTRQCMTECENALDVPGEVGDYRPTEQTKSGQTVTLENDRQAALWMDCVASHSCENLVLNYCAPIF